MNFILASAIVLYIFFISKSYFDSNGNSQKIFLFLLFFVHFSTMGIAYKDTIQFINSDAFCFYNEARKADSWFALFGLGSSFLNFLIYPLAQIGVSLFVFFLLFSAISYQAFLWYFQQMAAHHNADENNVGKLIIQSFFLLPSLHYWSGLLGKDVLVFFLLSYLVFQFKKENQIQAKHILVCTMLILLRPHISVAVLVSFLIYCLTQSTISKSFKLKLSIVLTIIFAIIIRIFMEFIQIDAFDYASVLEKFKELNSYSMLNGSSSVQLIDTSYIERVWLLLFRPIFYDAHTNYQYYISIENSIVLFFFILLPFFLWTRKRFEPIEKDVKFAFLAGISIFLMIAFYIYNLGLASRMRLMFFPLFLYFLHQVLPIYSSTKNKDVI